jgi:hypothetical protein
MKLRFIFRITKFDFINSSSSIKLNLKGSIQIHIKGIKRD